MYHSYDEYKRNNSDNLGSSSLLTKLDPFISTTKIGLTVSLVQLVIIFSSIRLSSGYFANIWSKWSNMTSHGQSICGRTTESDN